MKRLGLSINKIVESASGLTQVKKDTLQFGDTVMIYTLNSTYTIRVLSNDSYLVSGGWFDKKRLSPMLTTISGCTWGGSMIKLDIVAALGLCLEFGNRVVTTPIQKMYVITSGSNN